ncbi:MAG TPA: helix-turn-helix transcriptional regulator [Ktedonobacterales bacterium]|nr:helix-turn-helix transcriptional regulator [Ktedonobacterales bacterium]
MPTLRDLREDVLMTQGEFAQACGVSQQTVSEWENGRTTPSMKHRRKLVEVLGKTPQEIREAIQATAEAAKKVAAA